MNTIRPAPKQKRSTYERKEVQLKSRVQPSMKEAVIAYALEIGENESFVVRQAIRPTSGTPEANRVPVSQIYFHLFAFC
jgi:hypothetical protein